MSAQRRRVPTVHPDTIYCSGPLFSPEEVAAMTVIARRLEDEGWKTYLPHRDGIEAYVLRFASTPLDRNFLGVRDSIDRAIFALDVFQIVERCDALVFNANGRVPDEGGVAEAAIAFAVGKPVVIYKRDARSALNGRDNAMVTGVSVAAPVRDIRQLPVAIRRALAERTGEPAHLVHLPPAVVATVNLGRKIWAVVKHANRLRRDPDAVQELVERIAALSAEQGSGWPSSGR